jgi:hypothetical protein
MKMREAQQQKNDLEKYGFAVEYYDDPTIALSKFKLADY